MSPDRPLPPHRQLYTDIPMQMQAALRDSKLPKSMSKEEFLKMILPDSVSEEEGRRKVGRRSQGRKALNAAVLPAMSFHPPTLHEC